MDQLTFYFDRCFGKRLPEALFRLQPAFGIEWHHSKKNRFKQDMPDDEWLAICGMRGWYAFSHDRKFHSEAVEAAAIKQHRVGAFCLPGAQEKPWAKMCYLVKALPKIEKIIEGEKRPYLYRIHPNARLERLELP